MQHKQLTETAFPKRALEQASAAAKIRPASLAPYRLDLRGKTIFAFTESPESTADCAFSLYRTGAGWELGVHTADVSEYVCENSPLDNEARMRRTAVEYGSRKNSLFPDALVDLCNLEVGKDRLAVSVLLDINNDGSVSSIRFEESVIRVAEHCIFQEIDDFSTALDVSSVTHLREKYFPYKSKIDGLYELAAMFFAQRSQKNALHFARFTRVYERDSSGEVISFERRSEPDSRAMMREIGFFVSRAVGEYMLKNKLPCIFIGQDTVSGTALDYLGSLVGYNNDSADNNVRAAEIADLSAGSPYYGFVCDTLSANLPRVTYSDKPIYNTLCASKRVVSFMHPISRYSDLLTQRTFKTAIVASGDSKNINLNRYVKEIKNAAEDANKAEESIYALKKEYNLKTALELIRNNKNTPFSGFPLITNADGSVTVILDCGIFADITAENAKGFDYEPAKEYEFSVESSEDGKSVFAKPF